MIVVLVALLSFALGASSVILHRRIRVARIHRVLVADGKLLDLDIRYARQRRDLRARLGR
jgi:hypothetical protein